jgi:hypothetical protein
MFSFFLLIACVTPRQPLAVAKEVEPDDVLDAAWRGEPREVKEFLQMKKKGPTATKARTLQHHPQSTESRASPSKKRTFEAVDQDEELNLYQVGESEIEQMGREIRSFQPPTKRAKLTNSIEEDSLLDHAPPPAPVRPSRHIARQPWSDEETKLFIRAFERHGFGNWKQMKDWCCAQDRSFEARSSTDLRDKYRNLARQAQQLQLVQDAHQ